MTTIPGAVSPTMRRCAPALGTCAQRRGPAAPLRSGTPRSMGRASPSAAWRRGMAPRFDCGIPRTLSDQPRSAAGVGEPRLGSVPQDWHRRGPKHWRDYRALRASRKAAVRGGGLRRRGASRAATPFGRTAAWWIPSPSRRLHRPLASPRITHDQLPPRHTIRTAHPTGELDARPPSSWTVEQHVERMRHERGGNRGRDGSRVVRRDRTKSVLRESTCHPLSPHRRRARWMVENHSPFHRAASDTSSRAGSRNEMRLTLEPPLPRRDAAW